MLSYLFDASIATENRVMSGTDLKHPKFEVTTSRQKEAWHASADGKNVRMDTYIYIYLGVYESMGINIISIGHLVVISRPCHVTIVT